MDRPTGSYIANLGRPVYSVYFYWLLLLFFPIIVYVFIIFPIQNNSSLFFFSVREQVEFNKSCNLIDSGRGRNFPIQPALGGQSQHILKNVTILSGNLLNDLCYYISKNLSLKPLSSTYYLCFHHYLLTRNSSVCCDSCHDYSPKMCRSLTALSFCCRKKLKCYSPTYVGRSNFIGENFF